ncbi:general odorant-binding protein 19d-like isoform X2 [Trichoplusia ni]|uniref:General odorant-binding protein 19d-like isoform X2 n=1 Tax=Trichoplusia ni TaxID=7111 RepID=A0A7E5VRX2_TRINI|nr:general odorant-binding protein 19d-like isoform X2 [Trichoplusia ni]
MYKRIVLGQYLKFFVISNKMFIRFLLCFGLMQFYGIQARTFDEIKSMFMKKGLDCIQEHPIATSDMLLFQQHKIPETTDSKCWIACVFKKTNLIDSKGMYDVTTTLSMFENDHEDDPAKQESSKKLLEKCKMVNDETVDDGEEGCDRSVLLYKCFIEHAPKVGFPLSPLD